MTDPIEAAIKAVEAPQAIEMIAWNELTFATTGRPASLAIPSDITDGEVNDLIAFVLQAKTELQQRARAAHPASRLVIARRPM